MSIHPWVKSDVIVTERINLWTGNSERKFCLLSNRDHRSERATKNLKLRLRDCQYKARGDIKRAYCVARRVRAARLLQSVVQTMLGRDADLHNASP